MSKIANVRTVLLSSPYADEENPEIKNHFAPGTHKSCGMVQITLEDGTTGLGEGYLGVFAPRVFEAIVNLVKPSLIGRPVNDLSARVMDLCRVCDYWSRQGAARHVISACEIAMVDARARQLGVPAYVLFGGKRVEAIEVYGSGGDSDTPKNMQEEIDLLKSMDVRLFKIRASRHDIRRTAWTL